MKDDKATIVYESPDSGTVTIRRDDVTMDGDLDGFLYAYENPDDVNGGVHSKVYIPKERVVKVEREGEK